MDAGAYAVDTDELLATADRLRDGAGAATGHGTALTDLAATVDGWAGERSVQAAHAFLATLAWAADGVSSGVTDLARRVSAAGGAYDHTERGVPFPR